MRGIRRRVAGPAHDVEGGGGENQSGFDAGDATKRLQDFVKEKLLPHKYPREVRFHRRIAKDRHGKIDRQALLKM